MKTFQQFLTEAFTDDNQLKQDYDKLSISYDGSNKQHVIDQVKFVQSFMKNRPESVKKLSTAGFKALEDDFVDFFSPISVFKLAVQWVEGPAEEVCKYMKLDGPESTCLEHTTKDNVVFLPEYYVGTFDYEKEFGNLERVVKEYVKKFKIDIEVTKELIAYIKQHNEL